MIDTIDPSRALVRATELLAIRRRIERGECDRPSVVRQVAEPIIETELEEVKPCRVIR